jgi:hypothetical protein
MRSDASYGSYLIGEDEFVAAVEESRDANAEFRHSDHIRLAWIYVRKYGERQAEERIAETIRRFAISQGHERKYHETLTRAWLRLVAAALRLTPRAAAFDEFVDKHGWLLDRSALSAFYSGMRLSSEAARRGWADPDRTPLPYSCADGGFDPIAKKE